LTPLRSLVYKSQCILQQNIGIHNIISETCRILNKNAATSSLIGTWNRNNGGGDPSHCRVALKNVDQARVDARVPAALGSSDIRGLLEAIGRIGWNG